VGAKPRLLSRVCTFSHKTARYLVVRLFLKLHRAVACQRCAFLRRAF